MSVYKISKYSGFYIADLFIDGLFMPGVKINKDYKKKYLHILAYASTVAETYKKVGALLQNNYLGCRLALTTLWLAVIFVVEFNCTNQADNQGQLCRSIVYRVHTDRPDNVLFIIWLVIFNVGRQSVQQL